MTLAPPVDQRRARFAFCLYDVANSAFPTIIITAIYVLYFKNVVVGADESGRGDRLWGLASALGAAVVFLGAPLLGAIADLGGGRRRFLTGLALVSVLATAGLALTGPGTVALAVTLVVLAIVGFEGSLPFYNAFLPELAAGRLERLSGLSWALGYLGGLAALLIALPVARVRLDLVPLVVAGWYLLFAWPAFVWLPAGGRSVGAPRGTALVRAASRRLLGTLRGIRERRGLFRFLAAYFFFNNGVDTVIVFAVAFSAGTLGFSLEENILLVVVMNVVAAPGAYVFGRIAERVGCKATLVATLVMWLAVVAGAELAAWPGLFTVIEAKRVFWGVAALASLAIGAVQATSRAFVGRLSDAGFESELFGFMAFAGKGSAILGPLVFGVVSEASGSQRAAVLSIGVFFVIGLALLLRVEEPPPRSA